VVILPLPEERSSWLLRSGTLRSRKFLLARRYKYKAYILGVYDPHFRVFRYASKFSGRQLRILATKYARGRKNFPAKKLSI